VVYQKRLPNDLSLITQQLSTYRRSLEGIVVESTYNWYWLVDGLMEKGYRLHLANTAAIQQYNGLKYTDDHSDARWLAHLLRLGVLPEGYIYPKEERERCVICCASGASSCIRGRQTFSVSRV
jgi:transposase